MIKEKVLHQLKSINLSFLIRIEMIPTLLSKMISLLILIDAKPSPLSFLKK